MDDWPFQSCAPQVRRFSHLSLALQKSLLMPTFSFLWPKIKEYVNVSSLMVNMISPNAMMNVAFHCWPKLKALWSGVLSFVESADHRSPSKHSKGLWQGQPGQKVYFKRCTMETMKKMRRSVLPNQMDNLYPRHSQKLNAPSLEFLESKEMLMWPSASSCHEWDGKMSSWGLRVWCPLCDEAEAGEGGLVLGAPQYPTPVERPSP